MSTPDSLDGNRFSELRQLVDDAIQRAADRLPATWPHDIRRVFHELEVRQADLESQNALLRTAVADSTEREQAERQLRGINERYELVMAGAAAAIWDWDVRQHRVVFSARWKQMRGFADHEISDAEAEWSSGIHPDDRARVMAAVQAHFEGETPVFAEEYRVRRKDGSWMWVSDHGLARRDADGRVIRMAGSEIDITERKRAEDELHQSEARFRALAEALPAIVWAADDAGSIEWFNQRWYDYTGRQAGFGLGSSWVEAAHPDDVPRTLARWEDTQRTGALFENEIRLRRHDGAYRWFLVRAWPLRDAAGKIVHWFGTNTDVHDMKMTEAALRQSREDLDRAQEVGQIGWWRLDTQRNVLTWSDENHRIFGVPKGVPLSYETFLGAVHPDDRPDVDARWQASLRGEPYDIEHRILVGGATKWVREKAYLEFDADGALLGGFGITQDITARRRAEESLRESEAKLRSVFASAAIGVAMTMPDGRFVDANPAYCRITGYRVDELRTLDFLQLVHPDDRAENMRQYGQMLTGQISDFTIENRYVRKGGEVVWVRKSVSLVRDADNVPRWIIALIEDVGDRKSGESALRDSRARLAWVLETTGIGLWLNELPLGRLNWDNRTRDLFFIPADIEPTINLFWERLHPDDREATRLAVEAALRDRTLYSIDHRVVSPDTGEVRWIRSAGHATYASDGTPLRFDGINYDITDRKQAEEHIRSALGEKEVLLKEIHHRVKNNMQVISSLVGLQAERAPSAAMRSVLQDVTHRVRSMALVHEKLYQSTDLARVDFAEYARSLLSYLWRAHATATSDVRLTTDLDPVQLSVNAAVPCGLILNELVSNALKHGLRDRAGGTVTVSLRSSPEARVCLRVRDNGVGLPPDLDWQQTDSLGLHLVHMLVGQLHANVEINRHEGTEIAVSFGELPS